MHFESPTSLSHSTTALLWSVAEHRGRYDMHDRVQLEDLHRALDALGSSPETDRPEVPDLWFNLRELLVALLNGTFGNVPASCDVAIRVQADRPSGSVMWKSADDGDLYAGCDPCICSFVALQWHICPLKGSCQPASVLEITQLAREIRKAVDK